MNMVKNDHTTIMEVQNSLGYTYCYVVKETESTLKLVLMTIPFLLRKTQTKHKQKITTPYTMGFVNM